MPYFPRRTLLAVLLFLGAVPAWAIFPCFVGNITFPTKPFENDDVTLRVDGTCGCTVTPKAPAVTVSGSLVDVNFPPFSGSCLAMPVPWNQTVALGRLPAGPYTAIFRSNTDPLAQRTFTVEKAAVQLKPAFGPPGTEVLITGTGIGTGTRHVLFGTFLADIRIVDADHIIAVAPSQPLATVTVLVDRAVGDSPRATFEYAASADPSHFTKVLFPIAYTTRGAFGSDWHSENNIQNDGLVRLVTDSTAPIAPNRKTTLPEFNTNRGLVVGIAKEQLAEASFASHVRDVSRSALDAGTELRVVTEDRTASEVQIVAVPLDSGYRYALRLYDIDSVDGRTVSVTATDTAGTRVGETTVTLRTTIFCSVAPCITGEPAFAAIDLRDLVPAGSGPVDVTVSSPGARLWAFISATNNDTQHVTAYTPQR